MLHVAVDRWRCPPAAACLVKMAFHRRTEDGGRGRQVTITGDAQLLLARGKT